MIKKIIFKSGWITEGSKYACEERQKERDSHSRVLKEPLRDYITKLVTLRSGCVVDDSGKRNHQRTRELNI